MGIWEACALVAVLVSVGSLLVCLRSVPAALVSRMENVSQRIEAIASDVELTRSSWYAYKQSLDGLLEEMDVTAERTDRHKRSIKQTKVREEKKAAETAAPVDPDMELILAARNSGMPV